MVQGLGIFTRKHKYALYSDHLMNELSSKTHHFFKDRLVYYHLNKYFTLIRVIPEEHEEYELSSRLSQFICINNQ